MLDLWTYLKSSDKKIFIYGTGNGADKIIDELNRRNIPIDGVFASNGFVRNRIFRGFHVTDFNAVKVKTNDPLILLSFGTSLNSVMNNIYDLAKDFELYAPDVPVVGNSVFDMEYCHKNKNDLERAYEVFEDDFSKKVFENIINFKLSGDLKFLKIVETNIDEDIKLLNLSNKEDFLDLGAYNGDTVNEFISKVGGFNSVTALEPDPKNFRKLLSNIPKSDNIFAFNAAVGKEDGTELFSTNFGRGSKLGGENPVKCIKIDSLDIVPSFIKIDVEGEEINALLGAENVLKTKKPKLKVAAYHKNEDIFSLPLLIKKLNPEYKIYLRHNPCIPAWDTDIYAC